MSRKPTVLVILVTAALVALAGNAGAQLRFEVLHAFPMPTATHPTASLIQGTDGNLYGTASAPFSTTRPATLFKMTPAGAVTVLHAFTGVESEQWVSALIQARDGNFYGTTEKGGRFNKGTVFKLTPDGTVTVLHEFSGPDGANPLAALVQATDGNFYGTAALGGKFNAGTVFRLTLGGTLTVPHTFTGSSDGKGPYGALIQATDGNFYGTTHAGGASNAGTVFRMPPAGGAVALYTFTGGADGNSPFAGLIQASDGNFYGTTYAGGASNFGSAFRVTPAGTLTTLHSFGGASNGKYPYAALIHPSDGNFYGTTSAGGAGGRGTVFKMTEAGSVTVLHGFAGAGGSTDGAEPRAALLQTTDGSLYGTTEGGGTFDFGTIFKMTTAGNLAILHACAGSGGGSFPAAGLLQATDGNLYGSTYGGGASDAGTAFMMTPGGSLTTLHAFTVTPRVAVISGYHPHAAFIQASDGNLYGTNKGVVFKMTSAGAVTVLHTFSASGENEVPGLIQATDGNFYGVGVSAIGLFPPQIRDIVFKITPEGTLTRVHVFDDTEGSPDAELLQAADGNFYGTTVTGGISDEGTIFKVTPTGTFSILHSFVRNVDGSEPRAALIQALDGNFYGTTASGGAGGNGTVFRMTPAGIVTVLHAFTGGTNGAEPRAAFIQGTDGDFYGTTRRGGTFDAGTVFKMKSDGTMTVLHEFTGGADGAEPLARLIQIGDGTLYGTAQKGGVSGTGVVFRLRSTASRPALIVDAPAFGANVYPTFTMSGWAIDQGAETGTGIDAVHVYAYSNPGSGSPPVFLGSATLGGSRPDVGTIFGAQFTNSGFTLDVLGLTPGRHQLVAFGRSTITDTFSAVVSRIVTVTAPQSRPVMALDGPTSNSSVRRAVTVAGWAVDRGASSGTGIETVHVWAYPSDGSAAQFLGVATYGLERPDVGNIFGSQFTNAGFHLRVSVNPGTYMIVAFARSTLANAFNAVVSASNVTVQETSNPALVIDAPQPNATVQRPFILAGWVVDRGAPSGTGIDAVQVWAFPTSGALAVFVGVATYDLSRPDVAAAIGDSRFTPSGFTFTVSAANLAAGTYDVVVFGRSTVTGSFTVARVVRVTVQ